MTSSMPPPLLFRIQEVAFFLLALFCLYCGRTPSPHDPLFPRKDAWDGMWGAVGHTRMQCVSWCTVDGIAGQEPRCVGGAVYI